MSRVLLADDHQVVRQGLRALLERAGFDVVAEAGDGAEAVRLSAEHRPDVNILDLFMPGLSGLESARDILAADPKANVILLTVQDDEWDVVAALRIGVRAYIVKNETAEELVRAIQQVVKGGIYLSPRTSRFVVNSYLTGDPANSVLTSREEQLLRFIAEGKTSRDIAAAMDVSIKTIESYRLRLMLKVDIHDTAGLVRYALRRKLIAP